MSSMRQVSPARDTIEVLGFRGTFVVAAVLFRIVLEIAYLTFVVPAGGYWGFAMTPEAFTYLESWLLYLALILATPKRLEKPSDLFLTILLFELIAPLLVLYALSDYSRFHLYIILLGVMLVYAFRRGPAIKFHVLKEGRTVSKIILIAGSVGVSAWLVLSGAIAYFQLNLRDVYEYRELAGARIDVGWMAYVSDWVYRVAGPALLAMALARKSYVWAGVAFVLHIFWFGVSAHKAVLFYPILVFVLWLFCRHRRALGTVVLGLVAVVGVATTVSFTTDFNLPATLFVRRAFFVPAVNVFDYYEFFGSRPHVLWSNSSITLGLIDYPYSVYPPAYLVGEWRAKASFVNASFLATGFMHAGIAGIIVYGILAGLIFRLIDSVAHRGIPTWVAAAVLVVPVRSMLISADLLSSLLTNGILVGIVLVFLLRSPQVGKSLEASTTSTSVPRSQTGRLPRGTRGGQL